MAPCLLRSLQLGCVIALGLVWALSMPSKAAPLTSDSSGDMQPNLNSNLITGLLATLTYSSISQASNSIPFVSTSQTALAAVDKFCDLLSYYDMLRKVNSGNSSEDSEFIDLQVILTQNLKDVCLWIASQVNDGIIEMNPSFPAPLNTDSCSLDQTAPTPLHEACAMRRILPVTAETLNLIHAHLGTVEGVNRCAWVRERIAEPHQSRIMQLFRVLPCSSN